MFRYSICDPFRREPLEMGEIEKDKILDILGRFPWQDMLDKIDKAGDADIHFSPSIEFENKSNRHGLNISIVDEDDFYIFYKRPKLVSRLFGLIKTKDQNFTTEKTGQSISDVKDAVTALINNDVTTLEKRWG